MKTHIFVLIGLLVLVVGGCEGQSSASKQKGNPEAEKAALQAAEAWLELVDSGEYARSWQEAAGSFKTAVPQSKWESGIAQIRGDLGEVETRKLKSKKFFTSLPDLPEGEYVIIQFNTTFKTKGKSVETITPMMDADGEWRVSGYYVK